MRSRGFPARQVAGGLLTILGAVAGGCCIEAAEIRSVATVRIVPPSLDRPHRPVFTEKRLARDREEFIGRPCAPATIRESLSRPYRFLGYIPEIDVACADGALEVSVRESSHRITLITFEPDDLHQIGVAAGGAAIPRRPLFPVPPGARRDVLRGLLLTREGDLYNHKRYGSDSDALGPLGFAIAFVAGTAATPGEYPRGAYLIQSTSPRREPASIPGRDKNYLGGTASYGPRAGGATGLVYRRRDLFGRLDSFAIAPN